MTPDASPVSPLVHERFRYKHASSLLAAASALGLDLPFDPALGRLLERVAVGGRAAPNRLAVQPMEGCDAHADGSPSDLTFRRYRRYGEGGSGLIWFEATSIRQDGRSNPHQLIMTGATAPAMRALADATREAARLRFGPRHQPVLVLQLTHSGRFSKPGGVPLRKAARPNPLLDPPGGGGTVWTDEELDAVAGDFVRAAGLAVEAGFDFVDIKACHGYLLHELLGAHTRESSRYGGPFENRARLLMDIVAGVRARWPQAGIAVRLNATDAMPFPHGFGTAEDGTPDLSEPLALARLLAGAGCTLLNITAGVPAHAAHVGRPYDRAAGGGAPPPEHPLVGVCRLIALAGAIQQACPDVPVVGSGYSWLRQFWPAVGSAVIGRGLAQLVGLGRAAFAYPDAPADLMQGRALDPSRCCIGCSLCTEKMRAGMATGCATRDRTVYGVREAGSER